MTLFTGHWIGVHDGDPRALGLFKRHYSYRRRASGQLRGSPTFIGQGQKIVLLTQDCRCLFVWQYSTVPRNDRQEGVRCSSFRNEAPHKYLSSDLIKEAEQFAMAKWPGERLYTYVHPGKVESGLPGNCFLMAGWKFVRRNGHRVRSRAGLLLLQKIPLLDGVEHREVP